MACAQGRPLLDHATAVAAAPLWVCGRGKGAQQFNWSNLKAALHLARYANAMSGTAAICTCAKPFRPFFYLSHPFLLLFQLSANPIALFRLSHWMAAWKLTKMAALPHSFALIASQFFRPLPWGFISVVCQLSLPISSDRIVFVKMFSHSFWIIFQRYHSTHIQCNNATNMYSISILSTIWIC